jgi:hypothetical protein
MSKITVANGWQHILDEAVAEASKQPPEWCFEIVLVETVDGALTLSATYVGGDVPLDDHLPAERKLPHPYRAFLRIRDKARAKSLQACECCGRGGKLVGAGDEARVRCARHEYIVDAVDWSVNPAGFLFESADEAMAHFLKDHGDGLEMMQELAKKDDEGTRH